jgi:DnaJ-class molecular chaperone
MDDVRYEIKTCKECNGTGIREFNHGLLSLRCPKCDGKGKLKVRIKGAK